jgi:hypothetical protein
MAGVAQADRAKGDAGAVFRDSAQTSGTGQLGAIQAVAPSLRVDITSVNMRDVGEIESTVAAFARAPSSGLIVTAAAAATRHRDICEAGLAQQRPAMILERFRCAL